MPESHVACIPARIACAFGVGREALSKEFGGSRLAFASVDIPPEEADQILADMDPALAFEMTTGGIKLEHEGWEASGALFEKLNGRYMVTAADDGESMWSFPQSHDCVAQHARAWARRHGDVRVTCELDPEYSHFDLHDDHLDGNDWFSSFRMGRRTPRIIEPIEFVSIEESASVKLAQIIARAAMLFLWAGWGPRDIIAAHELTSSFGTLAGRFPNLAGDICRAACVQLQVRIEDTAEERERLQFPSKRVVLANAYSELSS